MSADPTHDETLQRMLCGRWVFSHQEAPPASARHIGRKSTLIELHLQHGNTFTGRVADEMETGVRNSSVSGYWDVLANALRMGTSAADAEGLPISMTSGELIIGDKLRSYYRRTEDAVVKP